VTIVPPARRTWAAIAIATRRKSTIPVAGTNKLGQIRIEGMVGKPCEMRFGTGTRSTLGQYNIKDLAGRDCVLPECLVEVANAE